MITVIKWIWTRRLSISNSLSCRSAAPAPRVICFRLSGLGFRVQASGFRVSGFEFEVLGFGFGFSGFGFGVQGFGFWVLVLRFMVWGQALRGRGKA